MTEAEAKLRAEWARRVLLYASSFCWLVCWMAYWLLGGDPATSAVDLVGSFALIFAGMVFAFGICDAVENSERPIRRAKKTSADQSELDPRVVKVLETQGVAAAIAMQAAINADADALRFVFRDDERGAADESG